MVQKKKGDLITTGRVDYYDVLISCRESGDAKETCDVTEVRTAETFMKITRTQFDQARNWLLENWVNKPSE